MKKEDIEKLKKLREFAVNEESSENTEKLTPRQRLAVLFDNSDYKELFRFAKASLSSETFKDGLVCAGGMINGRPALAYASEFSYAGGSVGQLQANQMLEIYRLARQSRIPVVSLNESGGARISDANHIQEGFAGVMKESIFCSGLIPQATAVLGHSIGASAFMATLSDFVIMKDGATMAIAGANVNKAATGEDATQEELGGAKLHNRFSGGVHFVEKTEQEAIETVRKLLDYLPQNNTEEHRVRECNDPENRMEDSIYELVPENISAPFDMKKVISLFSDNHEFFEIQKDFAPNVITGFARFGGVTVGIAANQPLFLAGSFDSNAFRKMSRFVNFLSAFNFPLLTFVDVPGAIPTVEQHRQGILIHGAQLLHAIGNLKSLKISVVVRRCFGGAYCMLNPKMSGGDIVYAYPNAMIGIMSDKAMKSVLSQDSHWSRKIEEMALKGDRFDDPFIAASYGYVDDIIEPAETRQEIIRALKLFRNKHFLDIPPKHINNLPF